MTVWSYVVKRKTAKNGHFGLFLKFFFFSKDSNIPKFLLRIVLNEGDYISRNHDGGPCLRYPKRPKKAQKEPVKLRNIFFFHSATKNAWILTKFLMELPILCNYYHVKFLLLFPKMTEIWLVKMTLSIQQGRIHGKSSRVGRGHIWGPWNFWAGAVR